MKIRPTTLLWILTACMIGAMIFMQQAVDNNHDLIPYAAITVAVVQLTFFIVSAIPTKDGLAQQLYGNSATATIWVVRKNGKNIVPLTAMAVFTLLSVYHTLISDGLRMAGSDYEGLFTIARWASLGLAVITCVLFFMTRKNQ